MHSFRSSSLPTKFWETRPKKQDTMHRSVAKPPAIPQHLAAKATHGPRLHKTSLRLHVATLLVASQQLQVVELKDGPPDLQVVFRLPPSNTPMRTPKPRRMQPRPLTRCVSRRLRSHKQGPNHHHLLLVRKQEESGLKHHLVQEKRAKLVGRRQMRVTPPTENPRRSTTISARSRNHPCQTL